MRVAEAEVEVFGLFVVVLVVGVLVGVLFTERELDVAVLLVVFELDFGKLV